MHSKINSLYVFYLQFFLYLLILLIVSKPNQTNEEYEEIIKQYLQDHFISSSHPVSFGMRL
jgi:hypothetical protein